MLRQLIGVFTGVYEWMTPDSALSGKLRQMQKDTKTMVLHSGTVAECVCDMTKEPATVTKHYKMQLKNDMLRDLSLIETFAQNYTIQSWAREARHEFDPEQEFIMLKAFHKIWESHPCIFTPTPLKWTSDTLTMTYCPWKRFVDFQGDKEYVWSLIKVFFFESIAHGILHGDMSKYNLLVHPSGTKICVLDFGLAQKLTVDERLELLHGTREPGIAFELHNAWTNPEFLMTCEWWEKTLNSLDTSKKSIHSGLYARSLINLTKMYLNV